MKRILLTLFIFLTFFGSSFAQEGQNTALPGAPDTEIRNTWHTFTGKWMPDIDASLIGADNYKTLQNLRYVDGGLEGVSGYSKINTSIVNATYLKIKNGHQLKKDEPAETHTLVQAYNTGLTASRIYENPTAIGSQGNFTATELHTDASGAGIGRFASGTQGTVFYCNGVESKIYGGDESRAAAFVTSSAVIADEITKPKDYTERVQNKLQTPNEVAPLGGGNDADTVLLLHCDGSNMDWHFIDSSASAHTIVCDSTNSRKSTDSPKFGTAAWNSLAGDGYLRLPDSDDWCPAAAIFTVDFWIKITTLPANNTIMGLFHQAVDSDNEQQLLFRNDAGTYRLQYYQDNAAANDIDIIGDWTTPVVDTWYHIALVRGWGGNVNDWAITVDGTSIATGTDATAVTNFAAALFYIGEAETGESLYGKIDEFRYSKGAARWTANFTVPENAYTDDAMHWVVGSTRPLEGIKFYVSGANTVASTLTCKEWNGANWNTLTITDNTDTGPSLAQTGTVTWSSTEETSKPKYLEGLYLYFYQFYLDAGQADIYYVTVDTGFQDVVDIWDGVFRQPTLFQSKSGNEWSDWTLEVNVETESNDYPFAADLGGVGTGAKLLVIFDDRMSAIKFQMLADTTNDTANVMSISYYDGSAWITASNFVDLTVDDAGSTDTLNKTGVISWTPPDEGSEFPQEMFGVYGYVYYISLTHALDATTKVDLITGIPAQLKIAPFKFPTKYNNRAMLCGFTESNQGNRIDYSLPNAPDVFNGEESSNGGFYSLYFGGDEELSCATEIENRYGSNLISGLVVFKDTETYLLLGDTPDMEGVSPFRILPISHNVGCPAPLTLANIEMGYEMAEDAQRQVVIGLSYSGPFMFDGSVIVPLKGIENYFDPAKSECINFDYIDVSRGAYDQTNQEYNLLIPSGAQYITNNVWLVYDLVRKKWYEKVPATYPQSLFNVTDTYGARYIYGGLDTGYMMYIEDGNTWDGTGIAQAVETGDFFPVENNPWYKTLLRRVKVAGVRITEDIDVAVTHYADTSTSGTSLSVLALDSGSNRITRSTQNTNILAWSHRFKFSSTTSTTAQGIRLVGWGIQYRIEREDI